MHSRDQEIDDQEMTRALDLMVALLEEPDLKNRPECTKAKQKIIQVGFYFFRSYRNFIYTFYKSQCSLILQRSACLAVNPFTVDNHASPFNCTTTGRTDYSMVAFSQTFFRRLTSVTRTLLFQSCPYMVNL